MDTIKPGNPKFWIIFICILISIIIAVLFFLPKNQELPIALDAGNINYMVYFGTNEKVLEAGKDDIRINKFAELFNQSYKYTDDAGTTYPDLVNVIMKDGSKIGIWWGSQGFITVSNEIIQFNMQNEELEDFLSEIVTDEYTPAFEKTAAKGLELYVWKNSQITGNEDVYYTLLQGTNRIKDRSEIYDLKVATNNIDDINDMLSEYRNDTEVFVTLAMPDEGANSGQEMPEPVDMQAVMDKLEFPVDRQEIQNEERLKEKDIQAAREVVYKYFSALNAKDDEAIKAVLHPRLNDNNSAVLYGEETIKLIEVHEFDPHDGMLKSFGAQHLEIDESNIIVFKVDFYVEIPEDKTMETSYEEGMYYDWNIILVREDTNCPWLIYEQGY